VIEHGVPIKLKFTNLTRALYIFKIFGLHPPGKMYMKINLVFFFESKIIVQKLYLSLITKE